MKVKLAVLLLVLVTICYFTNSLISGLSEKSANVPQPVKIVINGSTYGTVYQTKGVKPERSRVETEAMDTVVRLAGLPREERIIQYQNIMAQDTAQSRLVTYIYENGHLPVKSGIGSFLDVPEKYALFSGKTPRDAFEQAHLRSALKYYPEPLSRMKDQNGVDRLTVVDPGDL